METSAVFWEPKIRTYGFQLEKGLSLLQFKIRMMEVDSIGSFIEILEKRESTFALILGQVTKDLYLNLYLVIKDSDENRFPKPVTGFEEKNQGDEYPGDHVLGFYSQSRHQKKWDGRIVRTPVELIHFQGPHYSDRFGIAYTAFQAIDSKGISIIASGCSVSCVYIVLAEGYGEAAHKILNERFEVPRKRNLKG